jgi:adenosylhomocysteinase
LGDGRSVNLFESDSIPNKAGDIFRSAVLILLASGIKTPEKFCTGINLNQVDDVLLDSGIYDAYYETYLDQAGSPK